MSLLEIAFTMLTGLRSLVLPIVTYGTSLKQATIARKALNRLATGRGDRSQGQLVSTSLRRLLLLHYVEERSVHYY